MLLLNEKIPVVKCAGDPAPSVAPRSMRHVALLIESSGSYGRGLLAGIARYNRERGGWSTYFRPLGLSDRPPEWLSDWRGDGILIRSARPELTDFAARSNLPAVNLRVSD